MQGCATKTVQRQRADYRRESKARHFAPVEIVDGEFNHGTGKNDPTLYRFHLAGAVEQTVAAARAVEGWAEMSRRAQREEIKRAADAAYDLIPDAVLRRRKQRRARPASAEIDTCRKVIETKLARLKDKASKLPERERERLMSAEEPGELVKWWLELRADMDAFLKLNSPQEADGEEVNVGGGQIVHPPPRTNLRTPARKSRPLGRSSRRSSRSRASDASRWTSAARAKAPGPREERRRPPAGRTVGGGVMTTTKPPRPRPDVRPLLTVTEVAEVLRLEPRTIYQMVSQRRIPFRKAGRQLRFDPAEVDAWTKANAER